MKDESIKCNFCGVRDCNHYDKINVAKNCSMFVELPELRTPMLMHLMIGRKAIQTTKVLNKFGFRIEEVGWYPFFRLLGG